MAVAQREIDRRMRQFDRACRRHGRRVADGLGRDAAEVERLAAMSQEQRVQAAFRQPRSPQL